MPTPFPDGPSPEIAAERERLIWLMFVVHQRPQTMSRASTAATNGYSREECEQRWPEDFKL